MDNLRFFSGYIGFVDNLRFSSGYIVFVDNSRFSSGYKGFVDNTDVPLYYRTNIKRCNSEFIGFKMQDVPLDI